MNFPGEKCYFLSNETKASVNNRYLCFIEWYLFAFLIYPGYNVQLPALIDQFEVYLIVHFVIWFHFAALHQESAPGLV